MLVLMWVLLIRPQRRRQVQQSAMLDNLAAGDEIVTAGGLYATVSAIGDDEVTAEIAPGTSVRIAKRAIAAVMPLDDDVEDDDLQEADAEELEDAGEPDRAAGQSDSARAAPS